MHEWLDPGRYAMVTDVVDRYRHWLPIRAEDPRSVFLVAHPEGSSALAGFLVGTVERSIPIYRLPEFGFIHDVWVEPAYRRAGAARALVAEAVRRFAAMGIGQVRLETARANDTARRLFEACGFTVSTIEMLAETGA